MKTRILIGAALLIAATMRYPIAARAGTAEPQVGTLVVIIPSNSGLVVAADTRHTLLGISCDNDTKIYFPKKPSGTVVTVTGTANFLEVKQPFVSDPCDEIARSPVLLSIPPIVTSYLEEKDTTAANVQLADLADRCVTAVRRLFMANPAIIERYVGKNIFHVVIASYDSDRHSSFIRSFTVDLPTVTQIAANTGIVAQYGLSDQPDFRAFGQGGYLVEHVLNGVGRQFVDDKYGEFLGKKAVNEIDAGLAAHVARNLIEATAKTTELISIPSGVGGPIDIFLLGSNGRAERVR